MCRLKRIILALTITFFLFTYGCNNKDTFPKESVNYSFVDTLGRTYFIYESYNDPSKASDDEATSYLTFDVDSNQNKIYAKNDNLKDIHCIAYSLAYSVTINDSTKTYLNRVHLNSQSVYK